MDAEEEKYRKRVAELPKSAMGQFALGRYLLEQGRFADAVPPLEEANRLQAEYAAALVALGDAYAGARRTEDARATFERGKAVALAQRHPSLADEIDDRLADL